MLGGLHTTAYEWILSNSQGGYALGPADLLNHRKYHGLLIASQPGLRRTHLVSCVEEKAECESGLSFFLDSNHYPNVVHPDGHTHLVRHFSRPFPSFLYSTVPGSTDILILKTIRLHPARNFAVVGYKNLGRSHVRLTLRPKFTLRDHHFIHERGYWDTADYQSELRGACGRISTAGRDAFVWTSGGSISSDPAIYRNVTYPTEITRGYEAVEDVMAPFRIVAELAPHEEEFLIFGDRPDTDVERILCDVAQRYGTFALPSKHPLRFEGIPEQILANAAQEGGKAFAYRDYMEVLQLSLSEFVAGDSLIAGFPWFSAWGRDSMISLEALMCLDGGAELACRMLKQYGANMRDGIVPNTLGEGGDGRNYDTVDASLWFGIRALEFWDRFEKGDRLELLGRVSEVIANYLFNPSLPFHVDGEDGLIFLPPQSGLALTWMDAKISGEPVTPRYGKPIEVNALWQNLLRFFVQRAEEEGLHTVSHRTKSITTRQLRALAGKAEQTLAAFFDGVSFADRMEDGKLMMEVRPNYIIALSLPFEVFSREQMRAGYEVARAKLLTPFGLRSLSPDHPAFRRNYMGNQRMRDLAYHQGAVWPWLLLPMAKVAARVYESDGATLGRELQAMVFPFRDGFLRGEMASVPELYDGEDPGLPKGAPAQCWSVAAILVIEKMLEKLGSRA